MEPALGGRGDVVGVWEWRWCSIWAAIIWRARGTVSAGVWIFSPPRLVVEEPRGDERQCLVVLPPDPVSHLIIAQARFALAALKTWFDTVFRFGYAGELLKGRVGIRIRERVVVFICPV